MPDANATDPNLAATVHHSGGSYPVVAGWDILDDLGERLVDVGVRGAAYIITDDNVMNPYGRRVQAVTGGGGRSGPLLRHPGWRAQQELRAGPGHLPLAGRAPGRAWPHHRQRWRRCRRRPGRIRRRHLPARHGLRTGAHQHGRDGRRIHRRQGRHQPARSQEPGRRFLPAQGCIRRRLGAVHAGQTGTGRGLGRGHQARLHPRRRAG